MADEEIKKPYHSEKEILDYIVRNYDALSNVKEKDISIGVVGGNYRVAVKDAFHVIHTLRIDRSNIDVDRKKALGKAAVEAITKRVKPLDSEGENLKLRQAGPRRSRRSL